MKYLIWAMDTGKFRTKTSWVSKESQLLEGEKMLSSDSRDEIDRLIKRHDFKNCASYGITKRHELHKHC